MLPVKRRLPNEPLQITWIDIPFKVREIILDKMDSKTRCLFSRCSKICNEEAKKSKFYIYGLEICDDDDDEYNDVPVLKIMFDEFGNGYWFDFIYTGTSNTIVAYRCFKNGEKIAMWTSVENGDNEEVMLRYARMYLNNYQKQVQFFKFSSEKSLNFTLKQLKNLKEIEINNKYEEWEDLDAITFIDKRELLKIDTIKLTKIRFTSEDLFDFKGNNAHVVIKDFGRNYFKKYLKMLKNGDISINSINIVTNRLKNMDFQKLREYIDISHLMENEDEIIFSFQFCSEDRKYSVIYENLVLKIETIEVFEKKVDQFIFWPNLPLHIQENVIDKMDSKNVSNDGGVLELQFSFDENSERHFWLEFLRNYKDQTIVAYKTGNENEEDEGMVKWAKIENGKPKDVQLRYLKEYLAKYRNVVKCFTFDDDYKLLSDFNVNSFKNLEKIDIKDYNMNSRDYFKDGILNWKTIRGCKHVFLYNNADLSFEQFLELDLETGDIKCDALAEGDNFKIYMNMLKNGQVHRNLKSIEFCLFHDKKFSFKDFHPISKTKDRFSTRIYKYRSNFKQNGIIAIIREKGDAEDLISIQCYEGSIGSI
ncbi:unnamed protein product [Caenorhabditis angaria]|uniref:F-box domain-containing protein n=1 Tax=Caenorhabditis angaria TaxID=860376 RepID=A0A9P1I7B5_9PELO|nr:unnamed protein product [Caenorhabditis angaria]